MAIGLALLIPAAAGAAPLPDTGNHTIVPNKSIGGVKLDMSQAAVKNKWGRGACTDNGGSVTCKWGSVDPAKGEQALVTFIGNEADLIVLTARRKASDGSFIAGKLSKWKTPENIHLGSPISKVPEKYPDATPNNGEAVQGFDLFSGARPNLRFTRFAQGPVANGHMMGLSLQWDYCHHSDC
jgi:hypothetical protein